MEGLEALKFNSTILCIKQTKITAADMIVTNMMGAQWELGQEHSQTIKHTFSHRRCLI